MGYLDLEIRTSTKAFLGKYVKSQQVGCQVRSCMGSIDGHGQLFFFVFEFVYLGTCR